MNCKKGFLDSVPQSRYGGYADFSEGVLGSTYITRISQYFFIICEKVTVKRSFYRPHLRSEKLDFVSSLKMSPF